MRSLVDAMEHEIDQGPHLSQRPRGCGSPRVDPHLGPHPPREIPRITEEPLPGPDDPGRGSSSIPTPVNAYLGPESAPLINGISVVDPVVGVIVTCTWSAPGSLLSTTHAAVGDDCTFAPWTRTV